MKRNKKWWRQFTKRERSEIVMYERLSAQPNRGSSYLPDDARCCNCCGEPIGFPPRCNCDEKYTKIMEKDKIESLKKGAQNVDSGTTG